MWQRVWYWLIDVPAHIVNVWTLVWAVLGNLLFMAVLLMLLLWFGFGIRWGW